MADNNTGVKDMFLRGIAVLGLIAVLLLGAWGIIQIAVNLPGFLGGVGGSVSSVFNRQSTTTSVVVNRSATTTATSSPTKSTTSKGASSTYVASGVRQNLYGAPDLAVRIISVVPVWDGRTNVTFEVSNYGTNVAPAGWSFVAELPIAGNYPYSSVGQAALYPGDRIVYTLGFDSYDYGYNYGYDYDYHNYEDDCEWDDDEEEWNCDDNDRNRRHDDYRYENGRFSVSVDPYGQIFELNEFNNLVSLSI